MITIPQCRAARGLLDWTQQDLATASFLSKTAINNFEKGNSDIKSDSLRAIQTAFENANIEFTANEGLKRRTDQHSILSGPHALTELLHNIAQTAAPDDEILFLNADARPPSAAEQNQVAMYADDIKFKHPNKRALCQSDVQSIYASDDQRRNLPAGAELLTTSQIIYGNKVATLLWKSDSITIIQSDTISKAERARFEACWHKSSTHEKDQRKSAS